MIDKFGYIENELTILTNNGVSSVSSLNDDEIIININLLDEITNGDYSKKLLENNLYNIDEFIINYINTNCIIGKSVLSSINDNKITKNNYKEYKIVGVINDTLDCNFVYYSKNVVYDLMPENLSLDRVYTMISTKEELANILKYYPIDDSDIISSSNYSTDLLGVKDISSIFKIMGKYGTIFFLIFSVIVLMSFVSTSIKFRKKEIGILRAIGCRSIDVMQMFIYECITMMIICLTISFMIVPDIISSVNNSMSEFVDIDILEFGTYQMLGITLIMLLIAILASIIPIRKLTKMKPIDTILDK